VKNLSIAFGKHYSPLNYKVTKKNPDASAGSGLQPESKRLVSIYKIETA